MSFAQEHGLGHSRGKEILADRKMSESSKSLRKKYPKGSLKVEVAKKMKGNYKKHLDKVYQQEDNFSTRKGE